MTLDEHMDAIYAVHGAGCCWHLVIDDGNVDDHAVRVCEAGIGDEFCETPDHCRAVAPLIRAMSEDERAAWVERYQEWPPGTLTEDAP